MRFSRVHLHYIHAFLYSFSLDCLVPQSFTTLLSACFLRQADPYRVSSLSTRTIFTPAEDDLLLRGLVSTGLIRFFSFHDSRLYLFDNLDVFCICSALGDDWAKVRKELLPSKEEQLLQFRFRQMTASNVADDNRFREYLQLGKEKKYKDSKWTHSEDLNLLRGS